VLYTVYIQLITIIIIIIVDLHSVPLIRGSIIVLFVLFVSCAVLEEHVS